MSDIQALIQRLRELDWTAMGFAADALESQAQQIGELQRLHANQFNNLEVLNTQIEELTKDARLLRAAVRRLNRALIDAGIDAAMQEEDGKQ